MADNMTDKIVQLKSLISGKVPIKIPCNIKNK